MDQRWARYLMFSLKAFADPSPAVSDEDVLTGFFDPAYGEGIVEGAAAATPSCQIRRLVDFQLVAACAVLASFMFGRNTVSSPSSGRYEQIWKT